MKGGGIMRIGILETGEVNPALRPVHGTYPEMFARLLDGHGFEFRTWSVLNGELPRAVDEADGWLITGSRFGAYEDHAWIAPLEGFIREVAAARRPMAGICFGHQIMAQALGGAVARSDKGWGIGRQVYAADGGEVAILASHQDQVMTPPEGAVVTASSAFCTFAGLSYGDWGVSWQAHPEFSVSYARDLLKLRAGASFTHEAAAAALDSLAQPIDSPAVADRIAAFFLSRAPGAALAPAPAPA